MRRRRIERLMAHAPFHIRDIRLISPNQLDLCPTKKRHRKITREMYALRIKTDMHRKRLHEKLAPVAIVERPRAEEERHGRIDRGLRAAIPGHPQPRPAKLDRLLARRRKLERSQQRRLLDRDRLPVSYTHL